MDFPSISSLSLCFAAVLLMLLAAEVLRSRSVQRAQVRAHRQRLVVAQRGEAAAIPFVRSQGYEVVAVQPVYQWRVLVDGAPREILLRPDLLLARGGRTFVADVKTGHRAPDPLLPATRRQLLEYRLACHVEGALLVDMEARTIRSLTFPIPWLTAQNPSAPWRWALVGGAVGSALTAWWLQG